MSEKREEREERERKDHRVHSAYLFFSLACRFWFSLDEPRFFFLCFFSFHALLFLSAGCWFFLHLLSFVSFPSTFFSQWSVSFDRIVDNLFANLHVFILKGRLSPKASSLLHPVVGVLFSRRFFTSSKARDRIESLGRCTKGAPRRVMLHLSTTTHLSKTRPPCSTCSRHRLF